MQLTGLLCHVPQRGLLDKVMQRLHLTGASLSLAASTNLDIVIQLTDCGYPTQVFLAICYHLNRILFSPFDMCILEPQSSRRKSADGKLHDAADHFENDRPQKILTVSITSVMNTLRTLHMKRSRHEYLVQALINILALVMSAIRPSNPEAVTISEKFGRSASPQDEWHTEFAESISTHGDPGSRNRIKLKLDISNLDTTSMAAGNMGKVGSPFRENFLESRRATSLDSYSTMLKRDFQLQLFDVSAALSPNNRRILTKPSSSEWNRSINQESLMAGPLCRPEIADTVDGTGILVHSLLPDKSQDEFNDLDTSNDEILSSALLHDNMEKYRRGLSTLQHQIRFNAEQDNISEMNASVAERHVLAGKAFKEVSTTSFICCGIVLLILCVLDLHQYY